MLGVLPLFHVFGLNVVLGLAAARRGVASCWSSASTRSAALEAIARPRRHGRRRRAADVVGVGRPARGADADGVRRRCASPRPGAAKLPDERRRAHARALRRRDRRGLRPHRGVAGRHHVASASTPAPGSIGPPLPGVEVRLVDADGDDVLVGDPGEIWVRGPNVFAGYWDDPEATARGADADGWLRTGDVAVADDDGYLCLVDRAKDLIIVSGFNVYPAEVEEVLLEHPGVAAAAVVGVAAPAHGRGGEGLRGRREPGATLDEDERDRLLPPSAWPATSARPRSSSSTSCPQGLGGKVLRRALR